MIYIHHCCQNAISNTVCRHRDRTGFANYTHISDSDLPASQEKVLHVSPAFRGVQLGLERQKERKYECAFIADGISFRNNRKEASKFFLYPYHRGRGNVDAGDRSRLHVVGDVAEHDPVLERAGKVIRKGDPEAVLDVLEIEMTF